MIDFPGQSSAIALRAEMHGYSLMAEKSEDAPILDMASRACEAVYCYQNYQKIALNCYSLSIMKSNNATVMKISVIFLHSSIGHDHYHQWT